MYTHWNSITSETKGKFWKLPNCNIFFTKKKIYIQTTIHFLNNTGYRKEKGKKRGEKRGLLFVKLHFPAMRVSHTFGASSFVFGWTFLSRRLGPCCPPSGQLGWGEARVQRRRDPDCWKVQVLPRPGAGLVVSELPGGALKMQILAGGGGVSV